MNETEKKFLTDEISKLLDDVARQNTFLIERRNEVNKLEAENFDLKQKVISLLKEKRLSDD